MNRRSTLIDARDRRVWRSAACLRAAALLAATSAPGVLAGQEEAGEPASRCAQLGNFDTEVGIWGIVRDRNSDVPLPGSTVVLRYEDEAGLPTPEDVQVETDEEGRFLACGLLAFREVRIRAVYRSQRGRERKVGLDRSRVVDLEVDLGRSSFALFSVVAADSGRPVRGASLQLSPLPISGVTDSLGRMAVQSMPPGTYQMSVRHIGYAPVDDEVVLLTGESREFLVQLRTRAIALAPIRVEATGRDAWLVTSGFYDRRESIEDGYFATFPEIRDYMDLASVFRYRREIAIKFRRRQIILLNGRPISRLGHTSRTLRELPFDTVRGIEAYPCYDAPPEIVNQVPGETLFGDCNLVAIWTR